ncbi:cation-translocating P-type ATPase [Ferroacidibacillus organovorans]|uniref:cation-translocating P-type ATPase n=1 Tax=Ferroacidibacillus organovorans TaxID=1765683 RepID=UPI00083140E8|nr:cation-translocating P-type ATPase [Ferroacidibacillus organovorans]
MQRAPALDLPHALDIVRVTAKVIRQNLIWALCYNLIAQAIAIDGYAQPVLAAGAMVFSSLFVLGNSLRIVGWSPWRYVRRIGLTFGVVSILALLTYFRL